MNVTQGRRGTGDVISILCSVACASHRETLFLSFTMMAAQSRWTACVSSLLGASSLSVISLEALAQHLADGATSKRAPLVLF